MANDRVLDVTAHIGGAKQVSFMMGKAPGVFKGYIISALKKERDMFVGKKGSQGGTWRKHLMRKKLWGGKISRYGGTGWSPQIAGLLSSGKITGDRAKNLGDLTLGMGSFLSEDKHIFKVMQFLSKGGTVTSGGEMIIPIWRNLNRQGIKVKDAGFSLKNYQARHGGMIRIRAGGVSYYHDKDIPNHSDSLMFIGVHKITVKKQFDIVKEWKKREPKAIERIKKNVTKAVEKINAGQIGGSHG